jgi:hypothetical protein
MLNAYVGIVSVHGLRTIHVEHVGSMKRARTLAAASKSWVGFWAVIPESEAQVVLFLLAEGEQDSALRYLSQSAHDIGRILPLHQ